MRNVAIAAKDIELSYGTVKAVNGISLTVEQGSIQFLIGPSGCGKSSFLRCLNLLDVPSAGALEIAGHKFTFGSSAPSISRSRMSDLRADVGMVFQQFHLFPHMTALENVMEGLISVKGMDRTRARSVAMEKVERVGLADRANARPKELSGGQAQRIAIARALAMSPKVMLFDEPTSALDPELVGEVLDVVRQLAADGMTMVIVTHEMAFARDVGGKVMFLDRGACVEEGSAKEVLLHPQSERLQAFLTRFSH